MKISELCKEAHKNAVEKGFYYCEYCNGTGVDIINRIKRVECPKCHGTAIVKDKSVGELLMLIVSELGEALEAHRAGTYPLYEMYQSEIDSGADFGEAFKNHIKDTMQDELADAVIRIADMCGYLEIDLEKHIELKMKYNKTRPYRHGKKY